MITVGSPSLKVHFCSNWQLAERVSENLIDRGFQTPVSMFTKTNVVTWYSGAPIWGTEILTFKLPEMELKCGAFDFGYLRNRALELSNEKYEGKFFKLHATNNIICLTNQQARILKKLVSER